MQAGHNQMNQRLLNADAVISPRQLNSPVVDISHILSEDVNAQDRGTNNTYNDNKALDTQNQQSAAVANSQVNKDLEKQQNQQLQKTTEMYVNSIKSIEKHIKQDFPAQKRTGKRQKYPTERGKLLLLHFAIMNYGRNVLRVINDESGFWTWMSEFCSKMFFNFTTKINVRLALPIIVCIVLSFLINISGLRIFTEYVISETGQSVYQDELVAMRTRTRLKADNLQQYFQQRLDVLISVNSYLSTLENSNFQTNNVIYDTTMAESSSVYQLTNVTGKSIQLNNPYAYLYRYASSNNINTQQSLLLANLSRLEPILISYSADELSTFSITLPDGLYYEYPITSYSPLFSNPVYNPLNDSSYVNLLQRFSGNPSSGFYVELNTSTQSLKVCAVLTYLPSDNNCGSNGYTQFCGVICQQTWSAQIFSAYLALLSNNSQYEVYIVDNVANQRIIYDNQSVINNTFWQQEFQGSQANVYSFFNSFSKSFSQDASLELERLINIRQFALNNNSKQTQAYSLNQISLSGLTALPNELMLIEKTSEQLFAQSLDSLNNSINSNVLATILIMCALQVLLGMIQFKIVRITAQQFIDPIDALLTKVKAINEGDLTVRVIDRSFQAPSFELGQLYHNFQLLNETIKYETDLFYKGDDAVALMNYTKALMRNKEVGNRRGVGIAYNNIGNIHFKAGRIDKAEQCYRNAVRIVEKELLTLFRADSLFVVYRLRPFGGWESLRNDQGVPLLQAQQHQNAAPRPPQKIVVSAVKRQALEDVYNNRVFNWCQAKIELAKVCEDEGQRMQRFIEIIDLLSLVQKLDSYHSLCRSREIRCSIQISEAFLQITEVYKTQRQQEIYKINSIIKNISDLSSLINQTSSEKKERIAELEAQIKKLQLQQEQHTEIFQKIEEKLGDNLYQAIKFNDKGISTLEKYKNIYTLFHDSDKSDTPPEILSQYLKMMAGLFVKNQRNYKKALECLTDSIRIGRVYHPSVRRNSLIEIHNTFSELINVYQSKIENFKNEEKKDGIAKKEEIDKCEQLITKMRTFLPHINGLILYNKNVIAKKNYIYLHSVFVLDYSASIEVGSRKKFALWALMQMVNNYVSYEDRIGYVRFNTNVYVEFELQSMLNEQHGTFIRNHIRSTEWKTAEGRSSLYDALYQALKLFSRAQEKGHEKFIVLLTDGDDNASNINYEQIEQAFQSQKEVSLCTIGLGLNEREQDRLERLCQKTPNGIFVASAQSEEIQGCFQTISNLIFTTDWNENSLNHEKFEN